MAHAKQHHQAPDLESVQFPGRIPPHQPLNPQVQRPQPSLSSVLPGLSSLIKPPLASSKADEDSAPHALVMSPKHKRGRERKGGMSKTDFAWKLGDLKTPQRRMKGVPPRKTCSRELSSGHSLLEPATQLHSHQDKNIRQTQIGGLLQELRSILPKAARD